MRILKADWGLTSSESKTKCRTVLEADLGHGYMKSKLLPSSRFHLTHVVDEWRIKYDTANGRMTSANVADVVRALKRPGLLNND